jgi:hypothetical protein
MTGPIEDAKNTISKIVDKIKGFFSGMKLSIPKPHIPKIDVGWKTVGEGKFSVKVPTISWNATGNIFKGASLLGGGQGVGEAGAEVVMPISRKRYMKPYASMVASMLPQFKDNQQTGPNQYNIHFNEPVVVRQDADITKIAEELEKRTRQQERAKGILSSR